MLVHAAGRLEIYRARFFPYRTAIFRKESPPRIASALLFAPHESMFPGKKA